MQENPRKRYIVRLFMYFTFFCTFKRQLHSGTDHIFFSFSCVAMIQSYTILRNETCERERCSTYASLFLRHAGKDIGFFHVRVFLFSSRGVK